MTSIIITSIISVANVYVDSFLHTIKVSFRFEQFRNTHGYEKSNDRALYETTEDIAPMMFIVGDTTQTGIDYKRNQ